MHLSMSSYSGRGGDLAETFFVQMPDCRAFVDGQKNP